ncbi:MAG: DUF58 domain-containing protein [Planctomycetota bacterium]
MPELVPTADQNAGTERLLDPDFMRRLEQLEIVSRKIHASRQKGERRSKRKGESAEFADYRNYVVGDDIRHIDWNVYARLEKLFLKLFLEEEELHVSVLIDVSASMENGTPSKALYAKRVAAAMAYIGLCNHDRVNLYAYSDRTTGRMTGLRGRRMTAQAMKFLDEIPVEGGSRFSSAARQFALRHSQKGVVLVVSDFLDKGGFDEGLRYLLGRHMDIYVLQVLSPEEMSPVMTGDLKLVDCEDEEIAEVTISRALIDKYKANVQGHCDSLRAYCHQRGISYLFATTDQPFEALVLTYLRQRGLVR